MLQKQFRQRIGLSENEEVTFNKLEDILIKTATTIPFENLCVIHATTKNITKQNLVDKILIQNEGGLCYELNSILYYFLLENEFDVSLIRGVIYDNNAQDWGPMGKTHIAILLKYDGAIYLVDTGFGGNLPLKPVPITGETIQSFNGEFRVIKQDTPHGNFLLQLKLKYKDADWKTGYAFDSNYIVQHISELNKIQETIIEHPQSPFNKRSLATKLQYDGSITLTENSLTIWKNGDETKESLPPHSFKQLYIKHFQ
ncbi:arylamine N-acetyltransferase family protein [Oceanobacillus kimchii]|uniref:arylamine N-acetyltransferase family protein n=1 Tax=Oceanobacillus kimchii TaxID=746691 RepID=UPI000348F0E1|nr:arylamine N-acetyltransferase [Oceanobacillus kimchii]